MIGENLKLLRKRRKLSQEEIAIELGLTRSSYSGYENGVAEPNLSTLIKFSSFYNISLDKLIKRDLGKVSENEWDKIDKGIEADVEGKNLRVLAMTVDNDNNDNIELVPEKARAGYTSGFSDPDFISVLPTFQLPFLKKDRKYRTFPIKGDSMPPVSDGSFVVAEYVENWSNIKDGYPYIVVTLDDGIVFKNVYKRLSDSQSFQLCSTNPAYEPYEVHANEIVEIWKFVNYISSDLPTSEFKESELTKAILELQKDVKHLKNVYIPKKG
ncbi:helix-turn-helix domain-containing protein [Paracrocinitomix mangrovi]|uniref:helix-turn-helix domain-containing protein n=1 Tax=Paracrocinitomix mangrovi TaxID=2862509 RepID=UPI001C8F06AE|nr:helix-turn-helix domain-containing protein [Paracrocinitomix mangrovi]UKN01830.1 helix-turn-helix domain-containing protein [Paracrocinitomix mangrovi]